MRKKLFLRVIVAVISISAFAQNVQAQCAAECLSNSVLLNTGYDFTTSSTYPSGVRDEWWQVVQVPSGSVSEGVPYCAYVVNSAGTGWDNQPGSMWLNVVKTPANTFDNWGGTVCAGSGVGNPFRFERKFVICQTSISVTIHLEMMSDDLIDRVLVDGVTVAAFSGSYLCTPTPPPYHSPFYWANRQIVNYVATLAPGTHRIDVDLRNIAAINSGIDIQGTVTSSSAFLSKPTCGAGKNQCNPVPPEAPKSTGLNNINNDENSDITIFPNPTNDNITVESKGTAIKHIFISDITGRVLINKACGGTNKENISLSKYPAGIYIIKVNENIIQKINKVE